MRIKRTAKLILTGNMAAMVLLVMPLFVVDLFYENYSTLSLTTKGYFYVLVMGIVFAIVLGYETFHLNRKYWLYIFIASIAGTIVPHHVPYNLQGNIHLILAYLSFGVIASITYMNVFTHYNRTLMNGFTLMLCILALCFMKFMMINIIAELCAMTYVLFANLYLYLKNN